MSASSTGLLKVLFTTYPLSAWVTCLSNYSRKKARREQKNQFNNFKNPNSHRCAHNYLNGNNGFQHTCLTVMQFSPTGEGNKDDQLRRLSKMVR
ncbi:hypothetical protein [Trabulsiella odontotermitis]|uniref:hypothetical protein n=1 Tax=Trabulsiella odontotermitis TaxID=379893 RepID=UPI000AED55AE|nr:hypothetical protein [Trabulsiella odontotermitis]